MVSGIWECEVKFPGDSFWKWLGTFENTLVAFRELRILVTKAA